MKEDSQILLICKYPKWFLWLTCTCGILFLSILAFFAGYKYMESAVVPLNLSVLFILALIGGGWIFSFLFTCIFATETGLHSINPLRDSHFCSWEDIKEIKRPILNFPNEYSFVLSKSGKKAMTLYHGMTNYDELLKLVEAKSNKGTG